MEQSHHFKDPKTSTTHFSHFPIFVRNRYNKASELYIDAKTRWGNIFDYEILAGLLTRPKKTFYNIARIPFSYGFMSSIYYGIRIFNCYCTLKFIRLADCCVFGTFRPLIYFWYSKPGLYKIIVWILGSLATLYKVVGPFSKVTASKLNVSSSKIFVL